MAQKDVLYDVAIIGAGPAGMTAAIYAGRAGKTVALIDKDGFGGQIAKSPRVENIPGFASVSGIDFAGKMFEQVRTAGAVDYTLGEAVLVQYQYGLFKIYIEKEPVICSKTLIFATGCKHRTLDLPTKDIYYCVTCDGPFFKNKNVMVVGSGNTGATYALELAGYCKQVYLCDIKEKLMCEATLADRVKNTVNITFIPNASIDSVVVDKKNNLSAVKLSTGTKITTKAIFSAAGMIPQTDIAKGYTVLDDKGYISGVQLPNVFYCGDCSNSPVKQAVVAAGDGAKAALAAINFLTKNGQ